MGILINLISKSVSNAMSNYKFNAEKRQWLKGSNEQQKIAVNYFLPDRGLRALFGKKVSDSEYDAMVDEFVKQNETVKRALEKIGVDESELKEIPPVTLYGYEESEFSRSSLNSYRSNLYSVTHLFFSSTQVYMYQVILNTMKSERKERTEEYFYRDITNFSTSNDVIEAINLDGCSGTPTKVSIEMNRFALIVPGDKFICSTRGNIEQQVRAMKNKLREKKNG